jgi:hypothetical protein
MQPDGLSIIEVEVRTTRCVVPDCGGAVVRHALGSGQSVDRCVRCFRRYQARDAAPGRGRVRRMIDEFISWRD